MNELPLSNPQQLKTKAGRPRLGSEQARHDALLDHALKIFMRDGYGLASIAKIASAAGVSTRTIYEQYKNKADLMVASVAHMVEKDVEQLQSIEGLETMTPESALFAFGTMIIKRVTSPELIAFFRMGVAEAGRFPELSSKMKSIGPAKIQAVIGTYLNQQVTKGHIQINDTAKAASIFCHMLIAEPRHKALLRQLDHEWNAEEHIRYVVQVFLHGVLTTENASQPS